MVSGLELGLSNISAFLLTIAPVIGIILFVLGGIIYGLSYTQPAENRGKWQSAGMNMAIGGIIIAVMAGAATMIMNWASGALTSS
ncbi:MAG: hypothetical protein V1492_05890 [Candidatus Micrarchaeota archaeon]